MSFINTGTGESPLFAYVLVGITTFILAIATVNETDQLKNASLLEPINKLNNLASNGFIQNTKQLLMGGKKNTTTRNIKFEEKTPPKTNNNKTKRRSSNNNDFINV